MIKRLKLKHRETGRVEVFSVPVVMEKSGRSQKVARSSLEKVSELICKPGWDYCITLKSEKEK